MQRFTDQTVIVTGGGGGIGGATCRRFAAEGAKVAVFDLNLQAAQAVAEGILAQGGRAQAYPCDIADRATVDAAVAAAEADLGPIDVLVNNAGWDVFLPFTKTVPAQWDKLIAINLIGALHLHHAVLPGMVARRRGRIVNVSSDAARVGSSGEAVYAACKGGLSPDPAGCRLAWRKSATSRFLAAGPPSDSGRSPLTAWSAFWPRGSSNEAKSPTSTATSITRSALAYRIRLGEPSGLRPMPACSPV